MGTPFRFCEHGISAEICALCNSAQDENVLYELSVYNFYGNLAGKITNLTEEQKRELCVIVDSLLGTFEVRKQSE